MTTELYKVHRPKTLKQVKGQPEAVKMLHKMIQNGGVPHAILFTGPSGCGKTTLARILKKQLRCSDNDFSEVNCADFRGIDMIREIRTRMSLAPIGGDCRIWLIDECHELTRQAQEAFLKMLEDTPKHVYFFLATTDPQKLIKTIKTRCTEVRVKGLTVAALRGLITEVLEKEGKEVAEDVADKLIEVSEGSARKALVILHQILALDSEDEQINAIQANDSNRQAVELARALFNPKSSWPEVASIIKGIDEEPESIRRMVLGYCANVALGGGKIATRAVDVIDCFRSNYFDSGKAGLVQSAWEAISGR